MGDKFVASLKKQGDWIMLFSSCFWSHRNLQLGDKLVAQLMPN
jgi:hypothetical protein